MGEEEFYGGRKSRQRNVRGKSEAEGLGVRAGRVKRTEEVERVDTVTGQRQGIDRI
jgi:hypothetical protein